MPHQQLLTKHLILVGNYLTKKEHIWWNNWWWGRIRKILLVEFKLISEYLELWFSTRSDSRLINLRHFMSLEKVWNTAQKQTLLRRMEQQKWKEIWWYKTLYFRVYGFLVHSKKVFANNLYFLGRKRSWMHFFVRDGLPTVSINQL